ncbi:MAG: hypothetical protein AAGH87_04610 [Pseudomonadota bacterium]
MKFLPAPVRALAPAALLALALAPACTSTRILLDPSPCLTIDAGTVRLRGDVDGAMEACAELALTPEIRRVVVNSPGGSTQAGREIGRMIARSPRTLVIDGQCASSCGNYFVPAAVRIEATPGSVIALHGTPDPALAARSAEQLGEELSAELMAGRITGAERRAALDNLSRTASQQLDAEARFAADFSVPPGWRLYREDPEEPLSDTYRRHFDGAPRPSPVAGPAILIVEPTMLESCLPQLDSFDYRSTFEESVISDPDVRAEIEGLGGVFSGTLACKPPEGDPVS